MSRTFLVVAAVALAAPLFAQESKKEPKLKIGDPAPPLVVDKWLVGKEVKAFEKDTVYVISFTALDTPVAAVGVAALSDLYDKPGGKGLVVVGVQSPNTTGASLDSKRLAEEVALRTAHAEGSTASYPIGWEKGRELYDAYVGKWGGPAAYVVDKAGKVAYFGPDATAAHVARKVLDGTWKGKADVDAMTEAAANLKKFYMGLGRLGSFEEPDRLDDKTVKGLQAELPVLEKMYKDAPYLLTTEQGWETRFNIHLWAQKYEVPEVMMADRLAVAKRRKNPEVLYLLGYRLASGHFQATPKFCKLVGDFTDKYTKLLDPREADTNIVVREHWYRLVVISKKYGNTAHAERYTKALLDAVPEQERQGIEKGLRQSLKDAGVEDK